MEGGAIATIKARAAEEPFNVAASLIFLLAILHTFAASTFTKLSHKFEHDHEEVEQCPRERKQRPDRPPKIERQKKNQKPVLQPMKIF